VIQLLFAITLAAGSSFPTASFSGLSPLPAGGDTALVLLKRPYGHGRLDFFEGISPNWRPSQAYSFPDGDEVSFEPTEHRRAVLVRFEHSSLFYWVELPPRPVARVKLVPLKTVSVAGVGDGEVLSIYRDDGTVPEQARVAGALVAMFPAVDALVCASQDRANCVALTAGATLLSFSAEESSLPRVLMLNGGGDTEIVVKTTDRLGINPKVLPAKIVTVGAWVAVSPIEMHWTWPDVVVDVSGQNAAVTRVEGSSLVKVPGFSEVSLNPERGLVVRPYVGDDRHPLLDSSSLLLAFPVNVSAISGRIPIGSARLDSAGMFQLPMLAAGDYVFKLVSTEATGEMKTESATHGVPLDVVFNAGLTVSGRVQLTSGGSPSDRVNVEVDPDVTAAAALGDPALMEKIRMTKADEDGRFRIVLGKPGKYHLRARWGAAVAERRFELTEEVSPLDLGELQLQAGAALHGLLPGCTNGEVAVIPVPDPFRPFSSAVGEVRHSSLQPDGHFLVEGLQAGQWSVTARCGGTWAELVPAVITVPPSGDVVSTFQRAEAPHR
jgi:hypothetical protein